MKSKSIYSIIHDNLRRSLILSLGITALVLLIFSYFSLRAVEEHASHFLMKHAERLAQAGINTQNIGDVDKEISRFAETWKETQDLDVRIDIYIDSKLIAHAGQLQPFKFLYTGVSRKVALPSGQTMNAQVQIGLKELIIIRGIELLVFELFILLVYFSLVNRMKKTISVITEPLELRVAWLNDISSKLPESSKILPPFNKANIAEVDDLSQSLELLLNEIVKLEDHIAVVNFDRGRVKMAELVAHNIKGAIATLQLKVGSLSSLSTLDKQEFIECVNSIRDVSTNLLKAKKDESQVMDNLTTSEIHLKDVVNNSFEMKKKQYQGQANIQMVFNDSKKLDGIFLKPEANQLQSVIDNLIDNAVEAIEDNEGIITLQVSVNNRKIKMHIKDNGKGIPFNILEKLIISGGSYGKPNGTGIGLTHAKETIEGLGGELKIESTAGHGTTVSLIMPRFEDTNKFLSEIKITEGSTLVVVDDDQLIHEIWKSKVLRSGISIPQVHHFLKPEDFNLWMNENGHGEYGSRHYLFDFDLKDEHFNGLDLIEHHGLALESVLVSGMAGTSEVYNRAKSLGVLCLPKDLLSETSIVRIN